MFRSNYIGSSLHNWNVNFSEVSASKGGYATSSGSVADDASATITFDCELSSPDDSCTLNGTIKNSGKIRAKYKGYSLKVGETTETSGTTVTNDDIEVTLTAPVGWEKDEKILNTNDTGLFSLVVKPVSEEVFPDGTSGDKSHTITLTFDFEQAEPES